MLPARCLVAKRRSRPVYLLDNLKTNDDAVSHRSVTEGSREMFQRLTALAGTSLLIFAAASPQAAADPAVPPPDPVIAPVANPAPVPAVPVAPVPSAAPGSIHSSGDFFR